MSQINVEQFANELGVPLAVLLEQLQAAGMRKHLTEDSLTEKDKTQLLDYLRKIHGAKRGKGQDYPSASDRLPKSRSRIAPARPRSIQVEVRKKRVLVKGDLTIEKRRRSPPQLPSAATTADSHDRLSMRHSRPSRKRKQETG